MIELNINHWLINWYKIIALLYYGTSYISNNSSGSGDVLLSFELSSLSEIGISSSSYWLHSGWSVTPAMGKGKVNPEKRLELMWNVECDKTFTLSDITEELVGSLIVLGPHKITCHRAGEVVFGDQTTLKHGKVVKEILLKLGSAK